MSKYWEPPEGGVGGPEPIAPIVPDEPRSDLDLTEGVKTALFLDTDLQASQFEVKTENGVVHLSGTVTSEEMRLRAIELARGVNGVADVRETIQVKRGPSLRR